MVSDRKLAANRANAAKSSGPKTAGGKARSARNGTSHGLAGRHLTLTGAERGRLRRRIVEWSEHYGPEDGREARLVERAALATVVLDRIKAIDEAAWAEADRTGEPVRPEVFRFVARYDTRWANELHRAIKALEDARQGRGVCQKVGPAGPALATRTPQAPSGRRLDTQPTPTNAPNEPTDRLEASTPIEPGDDRPETRQVEPEKGVVSQSEPTENPRQVPIGKRFASRIGPILRVAASFLIGGLIGLATPTKADGPPPDVRAGEADLPINCRIGPRISRVPRSAAQRAPEARWGRG